MKKDKNPDQQAGGHNAQAQNNQVRIASLEA
jgi:hypothetical protein